MIYLKPPSELVAESGAELSSALLLSGPKNSRDEQEWKGTQTSGATAMALP